VKQNPLKWLSEALLTITTIPILVMMVHVTADVIMKYAFRQPIPGTLEVVSYYYMVAIVVLPTSFVEWTRQSIAVELLYQMMPYWLQAACVVIILSTSAAVYGGLAAISWPDAIHSFEINEIVMGPVNVVIWPARFLLPVTMFITALVCVWHLFVFFTNSDARDALIRDNLIEPDMGVE